MQGLPGFMSERPLLISAIIKHAALYHRDTEIVTRTVEGPLHRYTYGEAERRSKRLARVLLKLGVKPGDRVGTLAWNTFRHFELYYAISGIGAVCHTINPRLFDDQIVYIINHAEDRLLFVDMSFVPLIERLAPRLPDRLPDHMDAEEGGEPATGPSLPLHPCHEALIGAEDDDFEWPEFDERTASSLCYTSGTTGNPKGVLHSHRSTVLHAFGISLPDGSRSRRLIPSARWCRCFTSTPGRSLMRRRCRARSSCCPARGWMARAFISSSRRSRSRWGSACRPCGSASRRTSPRLARAARPSAGFSGGSAVPPAMVEAFAGHGIDVRQGWGMTEMSPLGTTATLKAKHLGLEPDATQGEGQAGPTGFRRRDELVDDAGQREPHDETSMAN